MARTPTKRKTTAWLGKIAGGVGARIKGVAQAAISPPRRSSKPRTVTLRRWDAAKPDRLNQAQIQKTNSNSINRDLEQHLEMLRIRSAHEAANNGIVEGIINTNCTDIVGKFGPALQIESDDPIADALDEEVFAAWWEVPDINGEMSGPDFIRSWVRMLWICGEYLTQIVTVPAADPARDGTVLTRLHELHPRLLKSPADRAFDRRIVMGVKRSRTGKPELYYIAADPDSAPFGIASLSLQSDGIEAIDAKDIIHRFVSMEPNQARGVPWLAPSLQVIADIRDYDAAVLQAAISAAEASIVFTTENEDIDFVEVNETVEIERGMQWFAPPGYKAQQLQPQQPSTKYKEFRRERIAEYGRAVNMPGMLVHLDSAGHNLASARFDGQLYQRGLNSIEGWLERSTLNRLVRLITNEVRGPAALARSKSRGRVKFFWTWPVPPHVDPMKEAKAAAIRLDESPENRTTTLTDELAARGQTLESHIATAVREKKLLAEAELLSAPDDDDEPGGENVPRGTSGDSRSNGQLQIQDCTHGRF